VPHRLDGRAQLAERPRVGRIKPPRTITPLGDQPGFLQYLEVLRDSGAADRQSLSKRRRLPRQFPSVSTRAFFDVRFQPRQRIVPLLVYLIEIIPYLLDRLRFELK
jgi:hypothetical protein